LRADWVWHVPSMRDVNTAVSIDVARVHRIELTIPDAWGSPLHQELPVLVERHHARVGIAVADKERPVWQPRNIRRPAKVFLISPRHTRLSKRHHELLAVVGELENLLSHVVNNPDVPFRIVCADLDLVRTPPTLEQVIPLCP